MDRASGSGVFARDPDALIDLVELEVSEELLTQRMNQAACEVYKQALQERNNAYYQQNVGLDDLLSPAQMRTHFEKGIPDVMARAPYVDRLEEVRNKIQIATAWRVEGTLREFAKFKPVNMWFSYPVHTLDESGVLADIQLEDTTPNWKKNLDSKKGNEKKKKSADERFTTAMDALFDGINPVELSEMVEYFSTEDKPVSEKTIRRWVKNRDDFEVKNNQITPKEELGTE